MDGVNDVQASNSTMEAVFVETIRDFLEEEVAVDDDESDDDFTM